MIVRLYLDEDAMRKALVRALRARGADVVTAFDEGTTRFSDEDQLQHAYKLGRVLYSFNVADFCRIHYEFLQRNQSHSGIVLAHQDQFSIGQQMRRLLNLISNCSAQSMASRLEFLSDW